MGSGEFRLSSASESTAEGACPLPRALRTSTALAARVGEVDMFSAAPRLRKPALPPIDKDAPRQQKLVPDMNFRLDHLQKSRFFFAL